MLTLILLMLTAGPACAEQVWYVHDGDTIRMINKQSIRLDGIDAPELKQPMGYAARDHLRAMVMDKDVTLQCHGKSFKRRVCAAYVDGKNIQEAMVQDGFAYDSPKYSKGRYAPSETNAQKRHAGVWSLPGGGQKP